MFLKNSSFTVNWLQLLNLAGTSVQGGWGNNFLLRISLTYKTTNPDYIFNYFPYQSWNSNFSVVYIFLSKREKRKVLCIFWELYEISLVHMLTFQLPHSWNSGQFQIRLEPKLDILGTPTTIRFSVPSFPVFHELLAIWFSMGIWIRLLNFFFFTFVV